MTVLTIYFAGSGHGIDHDIDNDKMVEAFNNTLGPKIFFPGPGGGNPKIIVSQHYFTIADTHFSAIGDHDQGIAVGENIKKGACSSSTKRAITGKGWNRSTWYAINLLADYLRSDDISALTVNIVGHSRGSITVIMMLNDIFHEHLQPHRFKMANPKNKWFFSKSVGTKSWKERSKDRFKDWYKQRLASIWRNRVGAQEASQGLNAIDDINSNEDKIVSINAFLFDPVAGKNQGATSRKQDFPDHPKIKRVRVLRMEQGGAGLSTNMPLFPGFIMLSGEKNRNLEVYTERERLVIPLPGTHGAGLAFNMEKGKKKFLGFIPYRKRRSYEKASQSSNQAYIGTSYMVGLLSACGTLLTPSFVARWGGNWGVMLNLYDLLLCQYEAVLPAGNKWQGEAFAEGTTRRAIHSHHTGEGYLGGYINAHHRFLDLYL